MPKLVPSRPVVRNAPQPKAHVYIGALVTDDFGRFSALSVDSANAWAKKKLDRASQSLQLRTEQREGKARRTEAREWRAAERGLAAELRESDYRARLLWRFLKTRVRPERPTQHTPPKVRKRLWPYASVALPKYDGPLIDRRGERGVFARFRYYSSRTAEQGVSQRVVQYVFNGAALDGHGNPYQRSNAGVTIDETLCAFDHLEQVNWSAQKGAKLLMHGILAVDHRQTPDEMMACGVRWAEQALGRFGLPYLVTLHAPPEDGDQRNWHLHILWSFRPLERVGDHEWQVGEMLRTDLDNPQAMKLMRELYAGIMTEMSFEAGQNQVWTAKSNADRGLPHEPQVHLGAAATNRARSGEHVAANEENHERVLRSTAAAIDDDLRHLDEAFAREEATERAVTRLWARAPAIPAKLPEPVFATALVTSVPEVVRAAPLVPQVIAPSAALRVPTTAAPTEIDAPAPVRRPEPLVQLPATIGQALPTPVQTARVTLPPRIVNLRKPAAPIMSETALPLLPRRMPHATSFRLPALSPAKPIAPGSPVIVAPAMPVRPARVQASVTALRVSVMAPQAPAAVPPSISLPARASIAYWRGSIVQPPPPVALFDIGFVNAVRRRVAEAARAADQQRARDAQAAEATQRERIADQRRHAMIDRLLAAVAAERRFVQGKRGTYMLDAEMLGRFGVAASDLVAEPVQRQLDVIADRQHREINRIADHVRKYPDQLRLTDDGWTIDPAPVEVRQLVDAWRGDPTMQAALARAAQRAPAVAGAGTAIATSSAWRDARSVRELAMADPDPPSALPQPGAPLPQPGAQRIELERVEPERDEQERAEPRRTDPPRRDWRSLLGGSGRDGP